MADDEKQPIIIKRVKKVEGGHHGGAWKVAYADFVTAMMAFFLLLWLLNVTTSEQKDLISGFFEPSAPKLSKALGGAGGVMGGRTMIEEGAQIKNKEPVVGQPGPPSMGAEEISHKAGNFSGDETRKEGLGPEQGKGDGKDPGTGDDLIDADREKLIEALDRKDEEEFKKVEEQIRKTLESSVDLKDLAKHLLIDMTPEGLRIQIVDQQGRSMFPVGSAEMYDFTQKLHGVVAAAVKDLPNKLSIRGHTDSRAYGAGAKYTNWELSSDRANASRRILLNQGLVPERIENVMGRADRDHLIPEEPYSPQNRRISIILLKESVVPGIQKPGEEKSESQSEKTEKKPEDKKQTSEDVPAKKTPVEKKPAGDRPFYEPPKIEFPKEREEGIIYFP